MTQSVNQQGASHASPDASPFNGYDLQLAEQNHLQETDVDHQPPSPVQEYSPRKVDQEELPPVMRSQEQPFSRDSSSEDVPLRQQRPLRVPTATPRENSYDLRDRQQIQEHMRDLDDTSLLAQRRAAHQATLQKAPKTAAKSASKTSKKPGPRPWASKPIKKNDMAAKLEVIREIERYWGKGFIRTYIPKCHRPLVKKDKGGKRPTYRAHETDPKKWLPSVLKAILSIARLTANKVWLKKAMNDVVRYRIKHTGNRKPQLVTTDFDVLEDMLIKDWDVKFSFDIRYKHLLTNPQGQQDNDEDIDHILGAVSGDEGGDEEYDDDVKGKNINDQDDEDMEERDDSEDAMGQDVLTGQYLQNSGYIDASRHPHPHPLPGRSPRQQNAKLEKGNKCGPDLPMRPQPPSHVSKSSQGSAPPYHYGPPPDPWGRPWLYGSGPGGCGSYGGHSMYGNYSSQVPSPQDDGRHPSQHPAYHGMNDYRTRYAMNLAQSQPRTDHSDVKHAQDSPFNSNNRTRGTHEPSPFHTGRPDLHGHPSRFHSAQNDVKHELAESEHRSDGRELSVEEWAAPTTELGEDSNAAALEAELRATELELKVARLQAKRAALSQRSIGK